MNIERFIQRVQDKIEFRSQDQAEQFIQETLATLGERIYRSARNDIAAQLPGELKNYINARVVPETTKSEVHRFPLQEFYNRVTARTGLGYPQTVIGVKAVMSVLKEAISAGEWKDLEEELPSEYNQILAPHG